jgi:hypothetical protein
LLNLDKFAGFRLQAHREQAQSRNKHHVHLTNYTRTQLVYRENVNKPFGRGCQPNFLKKNENRDA